MELEGVKCICGKGWGKGSSVCAACGMASCSKECHGVWERKGYCGFHSLFREEYNEKHDMRSILYENVELVKQKNLPHG